MVCAGNFLCFPPICSLALGARGGCKGHLPEHTAKLAHGGTLLQQCPPLPGGSESCGRAESHQGEGGRGGMLGQVGHHPRREHPAVTRLSVGPLRGPGAAGQEDSAAGLGGGRRASGCLGVRGLGAAGPRPCDRGQGRSQRKAAEAAAGCEPPPAGRGLSCGSSARAGPGPPLPARRLTPGPARPPSGSGPARPPAPAQPGLPPAPALALAQPPLLPGSRPGLPPAPSWPWALGQAWGRHGPRGTSRCPAATLVPRPAET